MRDVKVWHQGSINQSINHKSLSRIATSRLKVLQEKRSLTVCREIRWWDLDTIVWRAISWDADGMTSMTELTSSPLQGIPDAWSSNRESPATDGREPDGRMPCGSHFLVPYFSQLLLFLICPTLFSFVF